MSDTVPHPSPAAILIVDDHRAVADAIAWAVQSELPQFRVSGIARAAEAVRSIASLRPAVVVVDWQLESGETAMSGAELKRLAGPSSPETRWVLFTAHATPFVIKQALAEGISACVSKERSYSDLIRAIVAVTGGRRFFCESSQAALAELVTAEALTSAECDVLREIAAGKDPKEIADRTGLALKTVYNTLNSLRQKGGCTSMVDLAHFAVDRGVAARIG